MEKDINIIDIHDNKNKNLLECNELEENYKSEIEFQKINKKISSLLDKEFEIPLKINKDNVKTKNFIFTENAIKKLKEIKCYISNNYPVLLEGPTGTAKTKSVEILCEEMGLKLKRFNLSSETKTADLFGRYSGDPNSFSGISFQEGVFIEAFRNGYILLLDEINLASNQVLQSIEECLDSHKISCEIPGMPWQEIDMGKGFNIIATQNPNKGLFANKRQDLGKKFLSRFHVINFDSFQKEELYQIAKGLGDKNNIPEKVLKELVDFHDEWSNLEERKNDILCFTIREIEATINAIANKENIRDAILCIYGSRYKSKEYEKLKSILDKYPNLDSKKKKTELLFNNEFLYITPQLEKVLKAVKLSFDNNRHIMIVGDEGAGKSQIAKYIAEYRDNLNKNNDGICYCECTEDLKCSDLIGNQYPSLNKSNDNSQQLMKWEDGFLTLSIINGKCCILDNIEEAPATITERLNGLLDKKLDVKKDLIFEIPECPQRKEVKINNNFRLICICNYNSISKMSPAFLNRFDIITLEDQLKYYQHKPNQKQCLIEIIDTLIKQHSFNLQSNIAQNKEDEKKKKKNISKYSKYTDISDIGKKSEKININFKYEKDDNLNNLIYEKIWNNIMENDLSIYKLSLFCRAVYIFTHELAPNKEISLERLVHYAYQLTISPNIEDDLIIEDFIYKKYLDYELKESNDNKYYFKESPKLKSFMAKLLAASMINLHICVIGKTGIGKTSCAREFSRIREKSMKLSKDFYMHSFHSNTKPSHFYGNITMKNNEIEFINGSLLNAMEKGTTFIADEMNLSPDIVMKSLVPALDLNQNCKMYIPGIQKKIQINQKFFFIACQNDFSTTGRNSLPKLLAKKLKCISYPDPPLEDIQKICSQINKELYDKNEKFKKDELKKNGENIAKYMNELNKLKLSYIPNWSIRDITKILKRVHFQSMEANKYIYNNINFVDNIVFYTLSGIYKKDIKDKNTKESLLKNLLNILRPIFNLNKTDIRNIENIFTEEARISKEKDQNFLRKGKCGISLKYIHFFNKNKEIFRLPSLYNELFQILLAHEEEPILIIGESGYKTYLSQLLLPDIKPIQLNSETNIGQLLGSTIFLSDSEVKIFYLKQIYNILDIPLNDADVKMVQNWVNFNKENQKEIINEQYYFTKKLDELIQTNSKIKKFKNTLEILKQKLINNIPERKKKLNNINLEFKPGLILDSILSGKSLILKYLSNLPTVVLERFNELFSGKHNLTLNEDIHDTFTKEGNKEFSNLGENFRIFATCSLGEQNKLSEAVLSRFTIICSDKYTMDEQREVLKSFLYDNKLAFNQNCIDEVIRFAKDTKKNSLSQMINALSLSNQQEIFKEDKNISRVNILSFILYRIAYGMSYKTKANPGSQLYDVEEKLQSFLPKFIGKIISGDDFNEEPLLEIKKNETKFLESRYNKLQIERGKAKEVIQVDVKNLVFTKTFTEMVDYIHLGIATNTPVILEGGTGLGKQTAINYVAYKLNYRIINFIITQSTKIEDLLGRNQIIRKDGQIRIEFCETKILKSLIGKDGENIIIVFHNLNKASSALMEALCSIFNKKQTNILRPDGKSEAKSKVNLIGIINSQSNIAIKDKLPLSLINCVFYYILPKLYPNEIQEIIMKKFKAYNLLEEAVEFAHCFNESRKFSYIKGNISYFSINDITKYILFRNVTKKSLDKSIILQIIFAYRFIQSDFIKDIMNELGFLSMKINPSINIRDDYLSISFKNKENKNEIKLDYYNKFTLNKKEVLQKINTLNIKQRQCILFLALSILCKRACIIQGDTASGKTHLIRLFSEMLGQKLIVYQINKETGLSIFTGQSTLLNHLQEEEISTIEKYFESLSKNKTFKTYISDNFFFNDTYNAEIIKNKWSVKEFNNLIQKIREYIQADNADMNDEEYEAFKRISYELEDLIQPYKRFKKNESMFLEALKKGYWVLIDGIESANPIISDKLIRLCDEDAELDLTETGEDIIFSKNSLNKIHPDFHLFINYNPFNKYNNNQLSEMFLNKCITFTLVPMDADIESSAQIIYGFMKNSNKIDEVLCKEISSKVAIIHQEMNNKILENQDFFSGGVEFTGRIIKFIGEELSKSEDEDDLYKHLINAFYLNYINSINNKNDRKNIAEVKKIIKDNIVKSYNFDTGEKNIYLKYSEIFKVLRNIQKVSKGLIKIYEYDFYDLLETIKKVEISDLNIIHYYIEETLKMLDEFFGDSLKKKMKYFNYYNLAIIKKLLKEVLVFVEKNKKINLADFTLNDEEELINKMILTKEIFKYNLVSLLESFNLSDNFIFLPDLLIKYINSIKELLETNDIKHLFTNLSIVKQFINQEINVTQLFPFIQILLEKKEANPKRIRMFKIILLIYKILENKIDFEFCCNSKNIKFTFKTEEKEYFKDLFITISLNHEFYFENSKVTRKSDEKKIIGISDDFTDDEDKIIDNNIFYIISSRILNYKIKINEQQETQKNEEITNIIDEVVENKLRILDELTEEFITEIKDEKRTYSIMKLLSKKKEDFDTEEANFIIKIWYLILFYDEEKLGAITPNFCLPYEKELIYGIKNIYEKINKKSIQKIITLIKTLRAKNEFTNLIYGSTDTFLYKIQAGFFNAVIIDDKDKKKCCIQIVNEINWYNKIISPFENFWSIENSRQCLKKQYLYLKEFVEKVDHIERYKNKLNELIATVSNYNFEGKEKNKEKLLQLLRSKLNNPTKEVYEICRENVNNYLNNINEVLSGNQIVFPFEEINDNFNDKDPHVICLNILKFYSKNHKKLCNIFKKPKNILFDIFQLDKEIEIISDILGNYALEKGGYIKMYEKKVMSILRAAVLNNIIKIGKTKENISLLFNTFLKLPELINNQIGGNGNKYYKEDILKWIKTFTQTDLEEYLLIPKFEPKDFLYLFLIVYKEEKENKRISIIPNKGFLLKSLKDEEIESILLQSLGSFDEQELNNNEKMGFQNYIEKICRSLYQSILPEKCEGNFNELTYGDLFEKLEKEKDLLSSNIQELKSKDVPHEKEKMNKKIIQEILNCFTLATTIEQNYSDIKLSYEDINFFKNKDWDEKLVSNYPGMAFWLLQFYSSFYMNLMDKKDSFGCFISKENQISFWYFQIRVISNIQNFKYNCYKRKDLEINNRYFNVGKELEDEERNNSLKGKIENFIKKNITRLIKEGKPVNMNWINLVLNEIPPNVKIFNKNLRHFYEFFAILLVDSSGYQKELKNEIIIDYIIEVLNLTFENKIEELFTKDTNKEENDIIKLINKPKFEIIKKIREMNQKHLLEMEMNKNITDTFELFKQIKESVPNLINSIEQIVKEKTKEYHIHFLEEKEKKMEEEKNNLDKNVEEAKKELEDCLSVIKSPELQEQKILEEKISQLHGAMKKNSNYFISLPKKETIYYKMVLKHPIPKGTYSIKIKNVNNKIEKIQFEDKDRNIYLQSSIFKKDDICKFIISIIKDKLTKVVNYRQNFEIKDYSFNSFGPSITFNPDVKEKMIEDIGKRLDKDEPKITFNGQEFKRYKLDNFLKAINKFDLKLLNNIKNYNENLREKIINLYNTAEELDRYLYLKTSNGKENDNELVLKIRELENFIESCKISLNSNLKDVNKIISLNEKIKGNDIFTKNHDKEIVLYEKPKNEYSIYISNISYLKYPMISDNGESITFSSKSFQMFLGSYIPSLVLTPFVIKLLNIKENKIKGNILSCNKNIVTIDEIDYENTLKIYIHIQNLKAEKYSKEIIEFQLKLSSENYKEVLIPFHLSLNIVPFSILFSLKDYYLIYDSTKNFFHMNSPILYANTAIEFSFNYLYSSKNKNQLNNNIVDFVYSLDSLENNNSKKPEIDKEKNKLTLTIPKYENAQNNIINFFLKIYFSTTFYINILFNSKIYPFDFSFKWYSYNKKRFTDDEVKIYIDEETIKNGYKLFFKIEKASCKADFQYDCNLPHEIKAISPDFHEKKNKKNFIFILKLDIRDRPSGYEKYYIAVTGNKVKKKLDIIFHEIRDKKTNLIKGLFDLPKYKYIEESNEFKEENEIEKDLLYITPFNYYIPYACNLYHTKEGGKVSPALEEDFTFSYITLSDKVILVKFKNGKWYNVIKTEYGDKKIQEFYEKMKYLKYDIANIGKAKEIINSIDIDNNYWKIPGILQSYFEKQGVESVLEFIGYFPSSIKDKLQKEINFLNELDKDSIKEYLSIIVNNIIFIFYDQFKTKELEIKKNDGILYMTDIKPPKNILQKIKEKREEYFKINEKDFFILEDDLFNKIENENEGNSNYLLREGENPEIIDNLNQISLDEEKIEMKEAESQKFDLSNISLINLKYPVNNSINEIIEYYSDCNKINNILYFYIISASKSGNFEKQKIAGNYFQIITSIYEKFKGKNYSFFSLDINEFKDGYVNLYQKLVKIGCKLSKKITLKGDKDEENYIIFPNKKGITKHKDNWATEKNAGNHQFRQEEAQIGKLQTNKLNNEDYFLEEKDSESESEEEKKNLNNEEVDNIINEEIEIEQIKITDIEDNNINNNFDDDNDSKSEEEENEIKKEKKNEFKIGKKTDKSVAIDPVNINEKNFREEDGIKRALLVLEEEKRKKDSNIPQQLELGNWKKYHKFKNTNVFDIEINLKLKIQQLYNKASFLANQLFIKMNGIGKVKYFDTLVLILLDPSVYISEEIKTLNMFIVCAMTNALNCLEIKYSIILMGDEDFRCVLKSHKEPHSVEALERVYECLMLKRFRTNIPGCLKYSLEEVSNNYISEFKYTSFFIFTDGLDKSFIYTQKDNWDTNIFYKKTNSFGFIFLLSSILTKQNKEFLNKIWTTFLNETKNNSRSGIMLKSLELTINEDFKKKINDIFVLNFVRLKSEAILNEFKYIKPLFKVNTENSISNFMKDCNIILDNKSLFNLNGSYIKNEINYSSLNTNKEPLDTNYFKNNLHQIAKKTNNKVDDLDINIVNFSHKFLSIRNNLNRGILEEIFKPNKANLKILSNTGTEIDIMALILYFLNPVPDPMIYLQDAIGNEKEYAITVIIDTSFSVLNHMNKNHSLNTIRVLLSAFTLIDLPSFDLIVTGEEGPIVLCSEYPTFAALNEKSKLWELLFQCLSNPISNADLLSALQTAFDLKRMRTNNFPSFLFVLTDGLFDQDKQNQLKETIAKLVQTNIQVIGIGLGIYPYGISNIFGQAIFDINPNNILHSILSIIEGNINDKTEMNYILKEEESEKVIKSTISQLIESKNYYFRALREELKLSPLTTNCYDMLTDEVNAGLDGEGRPINPKGEKIGLLKENSLLGQKILIVMLWSCALSPKENTLLDPKNIEQTNEKNSKCIKDSIDYLGVKIKTVLNYEDAIKEITQKDEKGRCNYYTVWVMCGPDINKLPDNSKYPGLVEQFIDCLLLYWENGGGVVLFCDNEPLYFQANMFLKKIKFKGEVTKTKLRITGEDKGCNVLFGCMANGNLLKNSIYDTSTIRLPNGTERMPIGRNVPQIFEGESISHANSNNNNDIKPFIPFAKNSSGNICIMIYSTQGKEGDIIIDCGYTKVFFNMSEGDIATWRYVQNLAGFLARPEAHMIYDDGETAKNYRPNGVNFTINYYNLYTKLRQNVGSAELDVVYMIDSTGSMNSWISGVKDKCKEILDKLNQNEKAKNYDIKFGGVFYRDPVDVADDIHEYQPLGSVDDLKTKLMSISAKGGGDTPEDWVGGYRLALNNMNWRTKSIKIIIHIADAGAHSLRFTKGDTKHNNSENENGLVDSIKKCAEKNISILGYQIGEEPKQSFDECKSIYDSVKYEDSSFEIYKFEHASDNEVAEKLKDNITSHISAFIAKN